MKDIHQFSRAIAGVAINYLREASLSISKIIQPVSLIFLSIGLIVVSCGITVNLAL